MPDEPVSAVDVSIQAQVINLLMELQERLGLSYPFIAHDLSVIRHLSDRVGVMYLGRIVESSPTDDLYNNPLHPYTRALLSAIPVPDPVAESKRTRQVLAGEIPSPDRVYPGCRFADRCPIAEAQCNSGRTWLSGTLHHVLVSRPRFLNVLQRINDLFGHKGTKSVQFLD